MGGNSAWIGEPRETESDAYNVRIPLPSLRQIPDDFRPSFLYLRVLFIMLFSISKGRFLSIPISFLMN